MSSVSKSALSPTEDLPAQYGIGGYYTNSNLDLMFAFDYKSVGKLDHIVVYRPGSGICWVVENQNPATQTAVYQEVYQQGDPANGVTGSGIGGYDLSSTADRVFAFDYECSGKLDDLVLYRPGTGIVWILQNDASKPGNFTKVYASAPGAGIGGYDLMSSADRVFAFDYEGTGKLDDLVLYRPGTGIVWILQNDASKPGNFTAVHPSPSGQGIGGYDLTSPSDRVFAFDCDGTGKTDDLVLYRPGTGIIWILRNDTTTGTFTPVYASAVGAGIGGYDLMSTADQVFAFDYEGTGDLDDLVLFRPGVGTLFVLQNNHASAPNPASFTAVFNTIGSGPTSTGIAGYDLLATVDQGIALDFAGTGKLDYLLFYRPGTGAVTILKNNRSTPASFDPAPYNVGLTSLAQVQQNLNNMIALNTTLGTYAQNETFNAYLLLTGSKQNSTSWAQTTGFEILAGVFAAAAGALGAVTGLGPVIMATVGFCSSFAPGMIQSWITAGTAPGSVDVNTTVAGLVQSLINAQTSMNKALGDFANDVEGSWSQPYTFNNQTSAISDLANTAFPTEGPAYDALNQAMSSAYLTLIWQTILRADYKVTSFAGYLVPTGQPDSSFYTEYYAQNPAYYLSYDASNTVLAYWNIGTGVSSMYLMGGSDGGMNVPTCQYLFAQFDRGTVMLDWQIPTATCDDHPPGPTPPNAV